MTPPTDDGARRAAEEAVRLLRTLTEVGGSHDGPECRICPLCQLLAALRQVRPEAVENLIDAAAGFAAALRDLAAPGGSSSGGSSGGSAPDPDPGTATPGEGTGPVRDDRPRPQRIEITD